MKNKNKNKKLTERPLNSKRLRTLTITFFLILVLILSRLFWIQFVMAGELKEKAYRQQTSNILISPKRGTIYDTNGKILATSAQVDTVSINPTKIEDEDKEKVAKALSDIFELNYDEILQKVRSSSSVETIIKKVEHDKIEKLELWMAENKLNAGINIDEDTKRYYPYDTVASNLIGFCGTDNQGLEGIENYWDEVLTGNYGKLVTLTDVNKSEISNNAQTYVEVENGSDLYLTIDVNIQNIIEKYAKKAVDDNKCSSSSCIIMSPSSGEILGMATYPNYDLNNPFTPVTDSLKENWDKLSSNEQNTALQSLWRNKNVSGLYEPGSTFKVLISSIALEENITETNIKNDFHCTGSENVNGTTIKCWKPASHGYQDLKTALANSCNPSFIQLGQRIGVTTLYDYFEAFGLFSKTGIETSGEFNSYFHKESEVGPVELATISFGQRFEITPIQLITAISSIANDGVLVKPKIVRQISNADLGTTVNIDTQDVRQVVSKETADKVIDMMEYVVTNGTGRYGAVKGYSIAGKTGTSEPAPGSSDGNTLSYVAIAPSDNPEFVALLVLYDTVDNSSQGSTIAGPIMSNILKEILEYKNITSENTKIDNASNEVTIPNVTNKTVTEAEKILKNAGLDVNLSVSGDKNSTLVTAQVPSANTKVLMNSIVTLYSEENSVRTSVTVPDLTGLSLSQAKDLLKEKNLNISYTGSGLVVSQSKKEGDKVEESSIIDVKLSY